MDALSGAASSTDSQNRPRRPLATEPGISPLLRSELRVLNVIRIYRRRLRGRKFFFFITGATFFQDFSLMVWLLALLALPSCQFQMVWTFTSNLALALIAGFLTRANAPGHYDKRLRTAKRISPSPLPCLELWLMTSLHWHLCLTCGVPWYGILTGFTIFVILLLSRILSLAYFMYQLAASMVGGTVGYFLVRSIASLLFKKEPHIQTQLIISICVFVVFVGYLAYKAERNETAIMGVPRKECKLIKEVNEAIASFVQFIIAYSLGR